MDEETGENLRDKATGPALNRGVVQGSIGTIRWGTVWSTHRRIASLFFNTLAMVILLSCAMAGLRTMGPNIPREVNGWTAEADVRTYDRKTLFKYIDGGAELYLAYRFEKAYVRRYIRAGEPDIVLDMYDMGTPQDAFGVFTAEREGRDIGIGSGSEYGAGLLRFFKGRFFVSIMTYEETPHSKEAVFSLANAIADDIHLTEDLPPQLLSSLPEKGLIENSIRYFYSPTILNLHYYVADENILLLDRRTEAVLAQYAINEARPYVLVIRYPSTEHAKKAFRTFQNGYMPDAAHGIVRTENDTWTASAQQAVFVTVVFDAPSKVEARSLLEAVTRHLEEKE